jgi:hypothetical protein
VSGSPTAGSAGTGVAQRLGIAPGQVILELGYDQDCDEALRSEIESLAGEPMLSEETDEVVDVAILWWREDDGDLVDRLVDALTFLAAGGSILLFTPKAGREGHVEPSDIQEAAPTSGLSQTSSFAAAKDWTATKLVAPKISRR